MSDDVVKGICSKHGNDRARMMDIVREVQAELGCVPADAMQAIAQACGTHFVEVKSVVSFYAFLSEKPQGKVVIRLCDDVVDRMFGCERIGKVFEQELGIKMGETTPDGLVSLEHAPCIGMCDQAPAALVNDEVFTNLSTEAVRGLVADLRKGRDPARLAHRFGDGKNASELVHSMVENNIRKRGPVVFAEMERGVALRKALAMTPAEVIRDMKTARLRGRGGAGFPTGMKWDFTRQAKGKTRYVVCNADEGEPGTFKDRVILTECADLLFEGMAIAGYAVGSQEGILYLRAEYAYLRPLLESVLAQRREAGLLGRDVAGKEGFHFDIRIQMGAGAYICGEETAMISSCEGQRGDPKTRPPFPAQKGYLENPTVVNNVETFCCAARVMEQGPGWFAQLGSKGSPGTKLLSVSGDCRVPGVYEVPFGIKLSEFLTMAGAGDAVAVQIGGPSGQMVGTEQFDRAIDYDDLATGGSVVVFGPERDLLDVVDQYMQFFIDESCGYCTPCRVGNVLLKERLDCVRAGRADAGDLDYLEKLGKTVKTASRCGLGQTSPNPILSTLKNFRSLYESKIKDNPEGMRLSFDLAEAVTEASRIAGRPSTHL